MYQIQCTQSEGDKAKAFVHNAFPVAFQYGGRPFPQGFDKTADGYISADQRLLCNYDYMTFEDSSAVEWTPRFTGLSEEKTQQIQDIKALDYVLECEGDAVLYYLNGTWGRMDDFNFHSVTLSEPFTMQSNGSRSFLPFFNLACGDVGLILGLGYTADWKAVFEPVEGGIHITVSTMATDFYLRKDESVRNIKMLAIFWEGELRRSFNLLRNHLVLHHIPTDEQGEPYPPMCCNSWGGMKTHNHLKYIDFIKKNHLDYDCYWIDAGWHGPDHETDEFQDCRYEDWAYNQGDWTPNRCAHPNGLRPISDAAHDAGMKLLLWFGTYCCNDGIGWHKEHPEWGDNNTTPTPIGANPRTTILHQLNFNHPEARRYLIDTICETIRSNGVDCYREDTPPIYGGVDEEGRVGVNEMKAVQLFYDYWDELHERFPDLLIDNCGGGGSHIDLETIGRSYVLWRSDYNCHPDADPIGAQTGNYGLGHFVPLVNCAPPSHPGNTYNFHSGLYGGMSFGLFHPVGFGEPEKHTWFSEDYPLEWHKRMLRQYRIAKPYFSGSFYALTECSDRTDTVLSYQFDRPDLESGLIFGFFRQDCGEKSFAVSPVLEEGEYTLTNLDTGEIVDTCFKAGDVLTLSAEKMPCSILLRYQKIA